MGSIVRHGSRLSGGVNDFDAYCRRKEEIASRASIPGLRTIDDRADAEGTLIALGNPWTRALFDGAFYRTRQSGSRPAIGLAFVQSRNRNTVAESPSELGGGATDKHLIYEGLSRVDVDGVLAGAATARGEKMVFSVWHPEVIRLRQELGHARHPAQIIVTDRADLPIEQGVMFQAPELRVFLVARSSVAAVLRARLDGRPWVVVVDAGEPVSLAHAMRYLHTRGINAISAVGGRRTATALLREGLVQDLYLTTSPIDAGEANTPFYEGPPLPLRKVVEKAGTGPEAGVVFEHFLVRPEV